MSEILSQKFNWSLHKSTSTLKNKCQIWRRAATIPPCFPLKNLLSWAQKSFCPPHAMEVLSCLLLRALFFFKELYFFKSFIFNFLALFYFLILYIYISNQARINFWVWYKAFIKFHVFPWLFSWPSTIYWGQHPCTQALQYFFCHKPGVLIKWVCSWTLDSVPLAICLFLWQYHSVLFT